MLRSFRPALLIVTIAAVATGGCSVFRSGPNPAPTSTAVVSTGEGAAAGSGGDEQIDISPFLGPDYCPEMRVLDGAQLVRRYERGHEDDPDYVVWQASFGQTARECAYDQEGNLTVKVGVSGRVIVGPKGNPGDLAVPFKIAVVKFREAALATESHSIAVTIPPNGSTTFSEVREITVPSPGRERDYVVYVGFDSGEWDLEAGAVAVAPPPKRVEPPPPPDALQQQAQPQQPPPPKKKKQPNVLPTPNDGFILQ